MMNGYHATATQEAARRNWRMHKSLRLPSQSLWHPFDAERYAQRFTSVPPYLKRVSASVSLWFNICVKPSQTESNHVAEPPPI